VLGMLVMVVALEPTITSPGGVVPSELIVVVAVVPLLPLQTGQAKLINAGLTGLRPSRSDPHQLIRIQIPKGPKNKC
jgi:hypothetical protein